MATNSASSNASDIKILSSLWHGLNPALIARFYPIKKMDDGSGWSQSKGLNTLSTSPKYAVDDGFEVHCPITEGNEEMTLNWHSPFENAGAESMASTLSAMLQSGAAESTLQAVAKSFGIDASGISDWLGKATGRTGITKLNSTQIFNGMPPVKLSMTLHFRALVDPIKEVRDPIAQLMKWAVPQMLSANGTVAAGISSAADGGYQGIFATVFPSLSPQVLGMKYGDMTYEPMVIESISKPFTNPRSAAGVLIHQSVQITLCTLAALDRRDIDNLYRT
jgi:hypothetical protein